MRTHTRRSLEPIVVALLLVALTGCMSADVRRPPARHEVEIARPAPAAVLSPTVTPGSAIGRLAVPVATAILLTLDSAPPRWCVAFADTVLAIGDTVTLVWPDADHISSRPSLRTRVRRVRPGQCPLAQNLMEDTLDVDRETDDLALELVPADSTVRTSQSFYPVSIAIGNGVPWVRGPDHRVRADINGDGFLELARSCASHEGLHLTLWTVLRPGVAPDSGETPRWHAYRPLGYDMEPNCTERETDF